MDNLYKELDAIIEGISNDLPNRLKLRKFYREAGKILSKSPEFFYERDKKKQEEMFKNYDVIKNHEVICKSVVHLYSKYLKKLGIDAFPYEMDDVEGIKFNHWGLVYREDDKEFLINPIPDFYRVQLDFSTHHYCCSEEYYFSKNKVFSNMTDEELRRQDVELGYLKAYDDLYTDELLEKLSTELRVKIGTHVVKTSDKYQEYYLNYLNLLDKNISISKKTDEYLEKFPELIDSKNLIEKSMKDKFMDQKLKNKIHGLSYKSLINTKIDLDKNREGASYIGSFDLNELKKFNKEIFLYKFKYVMNTIPRFTKKLTGYIENKCFIDELFNIMFSTTEEKSLIHRHTIMKDGASKKEYYMIFSLNISSDYKYIYCFYNSKTKEIEMPIEPFDFMRRNQMRPLKESTLNQEIARSIKNSELNFINYDVDKEEYTQKRA